MIKAVTFDLWDTLIDDDSDEPKRSAQGLRSKKDERRFLVWETLRKHKPIAVETVNLAYDVADAAFNNDWRNRHITWTIGERLRVLLSGLGQDLPETDFDTLVKAHEEMEVDIPPNAIEGIREALEDLSQDFRLSIVSDAIVSPGCCLRRLLELHGLRQYFHGFAFSDEVGRSKPHRDMFDSAASQLGVDIQEMVHVGDRDHNDIKGPQALGMKAILFTAARDRDLDYTSADAVCSRAEDLPETVRRLVRDVEK